MAVYVDELRELAELPGYCAPPWERACHLMADTPAELDAFRRRLGLRREWIHGDHYDLTAGRRHEAVRLGAVDVTAQDLVALRRSRRT